MSPQETARHFDMSWAEFLSYCAEPASETWANRSLRSGGVAWLGAPSYADALDMARRGWPEGMSHVNSMAPPMLDRLAPRIVTSGGWAWDVTGAAYDVGEYLSGAPECWLTPDTHETRPVVSIQVLGGISASVSHDAIIRRGAATVALILALQRAGYAVECHVSYGTLLRTRNNRPVWVRTSLTDAGGGPLDIDRVIYSLAHPACQRWLRHTVIERMGESAPEGETLGPNNDPSPWSATLTVPDLRGSTLQHTGWNDPARVTQWLADTFAKLTGATTPTEV